MPITHDDQEGGGSLAKASSYSSKQGPPNLCSALPLHIVFISIWNRLEKGYLKRTMRTCTILRKEEKRKMKGSDAIRKKGGS